MKEKLTIVALDTTDRMQKSLINDVKNVKTLKVFNNIGTCIDYATDAKQKNIFLIITENDAEHALSIFDHCKKIQSIFILRSDKSKRKEWTEKCYKVKGVFNNIRLILENIEESQCEVNNTIGFDIVGVTSNGLLENSNDKNKQEVMFMYAQLIKEILTKMPYSTVDIDYMFESFFVEHINEPVKIEKFIEFERDYRKHTPIWWYTKEFFFSMLNSALRTHDISLLYPMRVFIHDLHQQIVELHAKSSKIGILTLYRGQLIPTEDFEKIKKNPGGLLSFNSFLSTTRNKALAEIFAGDSNIQPNKASVVFEINIDLSIQNTAPFADIQAYSHFGEGEDEYLFTMGSVFRIVSIKKTNMQSIWYIHLQLTNDKDLDLARLTYAIRSGIVSDKMNHTHICSLALLMMVMDESELATEILETVLKTQTDPAERFKIHVILGTLYINMKDIDQAMLNYEKVVNSFVLRFVPVEALECIYFSLGELCMLQGKYKLALINMEIALGIEQCNLSNPDGISLAHIYHNLGQIYAKLRKNSEALTYTKLAVETARQFCPPHHPLIGNCMLSQSLLLCYENRLEEVSNTWIECGDIFKNSLATNHRMQADIHMLEGYKYETKRDLPRALECYQQALTASYQHVSSGHPSNIPILCAMACVHIQQSQYDEAWSFINQCMAILNAHDMQDHYNMALTYAMMSDLLAIEGNTAALPYYELALELALENHAPTHPLVLQIQQGISRLHHRNKSNKPT